MNEELFNIWLNHETVIHCDTKDKSNKFFSYCKSQGFTWGSGEDLEDRDYYYRHGISTCYVKDRDGLRYSSKDYYESIGLTVIPYDRLLLGDCDNCNICNTCNKERCTK